MSPAPKFSPEEQEKRILDAAIETIMESSVTDFTMAKVANLAGLSMGSVYKLFQCKEDIVMALAERCTQHVTASLKAVLNLPRSAPEKIIAVFLLSPEKMQCFPFTYELVSYATNEAVIRKASANWSQRMIDANEFCEESFKHNLRNSVSADEFAEDVNLEEFLEEITVSGWSLHVGYDQVRRVQETRSQSSQAIAMVALEADDPLVRGMVRLINSYPWKTKLTGQSLDDTIAALLELNLR